MIKFDALLKDFLRGRAQLKDIEAAIEKILATFPDDTQKLNAALCKAREQGLPDHAYNTLRTKIPGADGASDLNATRLSPGRANAGHSQTVRSAPEKHQEFREGSVLRERFRLLSTLGEGGMSTVWKALDLLKEEARDPNPYVAVKLLSDDFREHPEAFIALQRESSKAMRLAHPNIATVYDFDRDGHTIYMTMEVLEGKDLTAVIRHIPAEGLPADEAMNLIEQLASGLSYAHAANLVHSDLKPGNAFLTREGVVKLLDFGIARASKTHGDEGGEITLFDPGKLGALTPAYATLEMFEGLEPDPRDDIYALAIISYQLFSGRHPYGRQSAPKALRKNLSPAPILRLNKRQNRGLLRALALHRSERTASVDEFLEEIRPRKSYTRQIVAASIAGMLLTTGLAYKPVSEFSKAGKEEAVIGLLLGGDTNDIRAGLEQLRTFDHTGRRHIKQDERARSALTGYYLGLKDKAVATYDYPVAERALNTLSALYPDSARVFKAQSELKAQKEALLATLDEQYRLHLKRGTLLPMEKKEDIHDVRRIIARIDPDNPLLRDPRLPLRYEDLIQTAMKANKKQRTQALLMATATYLPKNKALSRLRLEVAGKLKRRQQNLLIATLQKRLRRQENKLASLKDFQRARKDLVQLVALNPEDPLLRRLQGKLKMAFQRAIEGDIRNRRWKSSESLLFQFATLFNLSDLLKHRASLSSAEATAGFQLAITPEREVAIGRRQDTIRGLLTGPPLPDNWENALRAPFRELIALLPAGDPRLQPVVAQIAQHYLAQPQRSRGANRFAEALALLKRGPTPLPAASPINASVEIIGAGLSIRDDTRMDAFPRGDISPPEPG